MSISNRHSVVPFVSGASKAMHEQRLAKVGYKSTKQNKAMFPSVCASVPIIPTDMIVDRFEQLIPFVRGMLEEAQDGIFRSLYESSQGSLSAVSDDDISVDSCIAFLSAQASGGRITIESLSAWFDAEMKDNLFVVIGQKLGFISEDGETEPSEAQIVEIGKRVAGYKAMIVGFASPKYDLSDDKCAGLLRAFAVTGVGKDDSIGGKLIGRIERMVEERKKIVDALDMCL